MMQAELKISERLDLFEQVLWREVDQRYGKSFYRKIPLSRLIQHELADASIADIETIKKISALRHDDELIKLARNDLRAFEDKSRAGMRRYIADSIQDIIRYFYFKRSAKKKPEADYCILITNRKFVNYARPVKLALEKQGFSVSYLFWNPADEREELKSQSAQVLPVDVSFPRFWKKVYRNFRYLCLAEDRISGSVRSLKGKKVLIIEGCILAHHIMGFYGRHSGFKVYCLQWGFYGRSATKMGWRNMPYHKFLVWGEFFKIEFGRYNPGLDIRLVGHHMLEDFSSAPGDRVILFAVQKVLGQHINEEEVKTFIRVALEFAEERPDYQVRIRSHPDFKIPPELRSKNYQNLVWHDYYNTSMHSSLSGAKYCVSISSTLNIESVSYGAYPIYLQMNSIPLQLHDVFRRLSDLNHVFYPDHLASGIRELDTFDLSPFLQRLSKFFFESHGAHAVENIVKELMD